MNFNKIENEILEYWDKNNTFQKSLDNRRNNKPFILYEGPPTANGLPGIHHVLTRTYKDAIARFQTMKGRLVERKAGWDEHGLPVEIEIQKRLNLYSKDKIKEFGVKEFNAECAESTKTYIGDWEKLTKRMGYWLDFQNAYRTSDKKYIEKVWKILDKMFDADLIYKDYSVVPWACDSETVLSNSEVSQGYKEVSHKSAYFLFKLTSNLEYMAVWTTTPWTIPANMALAINPDLIYNIYQIEDKVFYSLEACGGRRLGQIKGSSLVGEEYWHPVTRNTCPVLSADFVKAERTGIVHIAPAFGGDDCKLWNNRSEILCHVNPDGKFNEKSPDWLQGNLLANNFTIANDKVLEALKESVLKVEPYTHQYPHNWRTGKPLIYLLRSSWKINVNKIRQNLKSANSNIDWLPNHIKEGRFGDWLDGEVDWAISRERFWGTPLPFYNADSIQKVLFPDSPHKPEADRYLGPWKRTPEVLDCWFDSGAMPFAAFDEYKQADVICEAIDQVRGWFYSLLVIGVAMKNESPYKAAVCLGHVLDKNGQKMSKSKGNAIDPWEMFEKYGADAVRWYMAKTPVGLPITFNEKDLKTISHTFLNRFWNCYAFLETYKKPKTSEPIKVTDIDKWIILKITDLIDIANKHYNSYELSVVTVAVESFVDSLSNVWVRANRNRFAESDSVAFHVLEMCLSELCKVTSPIMPFISDHIWLKMNSESVHLQDFTTNFGDQQPDDILEEMEKAQLIVSNGMKCRNEAGINLKQILNAVYLPESLKINKFTDFIRSELNVKNIIHKDQEEISLDLTLNESLLSEGFARELVRTVQALRKQKGLNVNDVIDLKIDERDQILPISSHLAFCIKKLNVRDWLYEPVEDTFKVGSYVIGLNINKIESQPQ